MESKNFLNGTENSCKKPYLPSNRMGNEYKALCHPEGGRIDKVSGLSRPIGPRV